MRNFKKFDYLIVGAGLFGSTCARLLTDNGYRVLVLEKRNHIGGNIFTKKMNNIDVHMYGAHIFHTSNEMVWKFVNRFGKFNDFVNSPIANYHGEKYNLPFNMNTFVQLWPDVKTVEDAKEHIEKEIEDYGIKEKPNNLEEQAIMLVGTTIFSKLIKEYTEKQWARPCSKLPPFIIQRIPLRFTFDNNYFDDKYQGIPMDGYTKLIENMLNGIDVKLNSNFFNNRKQYLNMATKTIFTGPIDEYFDYKFGALEYRSLKFVLKKIKSASFQGNAVVNYTSHDVLFTRIIEHKFFNNKNQNITIVSEEYPDDWTVGKERFYTINDDKNNKLYEKYLHSAKKLKDVYFGGRLGMYKYFDMDDTIMAAFDLVDSLIGGSTKKCSMEKK